MSTCRKCGEPPEQLVIGIDGGEYCFECASEMPHCDDCDMVIEDGDYHLCEGCLSKREAEDGY